MDICPYPRLMLPTGTCSAHARLCTCRQAGTQVCLCTLPHFVPGGQALGHAHVTQTVMQTLCVMWLCSHACVLTFVSRAGPCVWMCFCTDSRGCVWSKAHSLAGQGSGCRRLACLSHPCASPQEGLRDPLVGPCTQALGWTAGSLRRAQLAGCLPRDRRGVHVYEPPSTRPLTVSLVCFAGGMSVSQCSKEDGRSSSGPSHETAAPKRTYDMMEGRVSRAIASASIEGGCPAWDLPRGTSHFPGCHSKERFCLGSYWREVLGWPAPLHRQGN